MKKLFLAVLAALTVSSPALAIKDPEVKGWKTYDAMGCMLLRECKDEVYEIKNRKDLEEYLPYTTFDLIANEMDEIFEAFEEIGIGIYLANAKYFPTGHRGAYHTISNNFYLNQNYMDKPWVVLSVLRHEGFHVAQDCMAGSIENSMIAIIYEEEKVPSYWRKIAEDTYPSSALPWESEAMWAGRTPGITLKALKACGTGKMWEIYAPTPMTREWLENNGYIE